MGTVTSAAQAAALPFQSHIQKRIARELSDLPVIGFHVFPEVYNGEVRLLRVLMEGEVGSVYENGVFELEYKFPVDYPFKPPSVKFITPIYHYSVNQNGGMCLAILKDQWSPALSLNKILKGISDLVHRSEDMDPEVCADMK